MTMKSLKSWRTRTYMAAAAVGGLLTVGSSVADTVVYDGLPSPPPGNVPSLGYEATSTSEFGDKVTLAPGPRTLSSVDLLLSSWACQSGAWTAGCTTTPGATFNHDITLNIYDTSLSLIGTVTQTFTIPYRPSSDFSACGDTRWSNGSSCFNGYAALVTFDSAALQAITLPDTFIFGVAYDTSHYGDNPIGISDPRYLANTPYDSLNVGLSSGASIGTDDTPLGAYLSSTWAGAYCDGGTGGTGSFRLDDAAPQDTACWSGYTVAARFNTTAPVPIPAAAWLLLSGLGGLGFVARRKAA